MSKLIALAYVATYLAQTPLDHNGKAVPIGGPIDLGPEDAQPLLDVEAIAHSDGNAPQALQAQQGGTDGVTELLKDLQDRDDQLAQARQDMHALQQAVADLHQAAAEQAKAHEAELAGLREQGAALSAQRDEAALANANLQASLNQAETAKEELQAKLTQAETALAAKATKAR